MDTITNSDSYGATTTDHVKGAAVNQQRNKMDMTICIDPNRGSEDADDMSSSRLSKATLLRGNHALNFQFLREGTLYDRDHQVEALTGALHRRLRPDSTPEFVLIAGITGSGKTVLARKLKQPVQDKDGVFVMGKFDRPKQSQPFAPLVAAMTEFVRLVLKKSNDVVDEISAEIVSQVGNDIGVLTVLVPALEDLVGRPAEGSLFTLKSVDAAVRLKEIFVKFVKAICIRPLVLVMDDLQWADSGSLELLEAIVCDKENHGLVVVGICRSNEVFYTHDLAVMLRRLEDEKHIPIQTIDVKGLSIRAANSLIASVLRSPEQDCFGVTNIIYRKTKGNVLFTVEFLKALFEDSVLKKDPVSRTWLWDDDLWAAKFEQADSILHLTLRRIQRLPYECQSLLLYAACLGTELDEDLLSKVFVDSLTVGAEEKSVLYDIAESVAHVDLDRAIERCAAEGVIIKESHACTYRFSHDQLKEAAYNLVPQSELPSLHVSLGRFLCEILSRDELEKYIFVVVDQMRIGMDRVCSDFERSRLASLCLVAGRKAMTSSDFNTTLKFLELGISLLDLRQSWRDEYELTLSLYNTIAQATCCLGRIDIADKAVATVIEYARTFHDTVHCLMLQIYTYGTRMRLNDSIDLGLDVLERLDEPIPRNAKTQQFAIELLKVKRILKKKPDTAIAGLPDMTDPVKLSVMGVLNLLIAPCFIARPKLFPLVAFKLFKLTLNHGASAVSSMACAGVGIAMANVGDHDTAYRLGQLALMFIGRYNSVRNDWIPRVYVAHYGLVALSKERIGPVLQKLAHAHQVGMQCGDVEMGTIGLHMCRKYSWNVGYSLIELEPKMKAALDQMKAQNQLLWYEMTHTCYEAILILMDRTNNPAVTNGCLMTFENEKGSDRFNEILQTANLEIEIYLCEAAAHKMVVLYHLGEYGKALEMAKRSRNARKILGTSMVVSYQVAYDAFTCMAVLRQRNTSSPIQKKRLLVQARNCLAYLKKMAVSVPENYLHSIRLIEAEILAYQRKPQQAVAMYVKSQELAREHAFLGVLAIAFDREAFARKEFGMEGQMECYQKAIGCYEEWGAFAKSSKMKQSVERDHSTPSN
ncbi:unnamed protein product [Cylindrotheca closterium]|uniref:Orc1-like AAA ATPase domain-containing protein n=1 Tax=Cylindrotheca closterium TaxID=2856 RepID=A0AAD2G5K8_9STRA|nr:unnamed protein product [Cylindrotheca closterium]